MARENTHRFSWSYGLDETETDSSLIISCTLTDTTSDPPVPIATDNYNLTALPPGFLHICAAYGAGKLLQDRTSQVPVGPAKRDAMAAVWAQLVAGIYRAESSGRGPGLSITPEVEAIAELQSATPDAVLATLRSFDADRRARILSNPRVVELAASIRARRASATSSLDLSAFDGDAG